MLPATSFAGAKHGDERLRRLLTRQGEGWLTAFEGALFDDQDGDDEKRKEERLREATAFAARRREMGWRLTHDELYNVREGGLKESKACSLESKRSDCCCCCCWWSCYRRRASECIQTCVVVVLAFLPACCCRGRSSVRIQTNAVVVLAFMQSECQPLGQNEACI